MTSNSLATYVEKIAIFDESGNERGDFVAKLMINRPSAANSFNEEVMSGLTMHLEALAKDASIRALILQSVGKHFSAGADLMWMQSSAKLEKSENQQEARRLERLFEALYNIEIPTIAVAKGAAYGGAVGLLACCDYAVATENARFCLSETRIGLIPAVILPYLCRKMRSGDIRRLTLTGRVFTTKEAKEAGLIQDINDTMTMNDWLIKEINQLLLASPNAQCQYKRLQQRTMEQNFQQGEYTSQAIADIRASTEGKAGLSAFFEKETPPWAGHIPENTALFEL